MRPLAPAGLLVRTATTAWRRAARHALLPGISIEAIYGIFARYGVAATGLQMLGLRGLGVRAL